MDMNTNETLNPEASAIPNGYGGDHLPAARKAFHHIGLSLLVITAVSIGLQLAAAALVGWLGTRGGYPGIPSWVNWLATFAPIYLVGIPAGLLVLRRVPAAPQPPGKLGGKSFWLFLLMCFPLMYGGNIIGTVLSQVLSGGTAENALMSYVFDSSLLKILVIVVLAPLLEEYVFRKQIIDRCGRYGEKTAILFSALTFGLFHMNLYQFFYAFGLGLVFAYVYTRTRRLRYPVLMHAFINFMGSVLAPWILGQMDMAALQRIAEGSMEESVLARALPGLMLFGGYALLLLALSVTGLVLLILKRKTLVFQPTPEELPKGHRFKAVYGSAGVILFSVLCIVMCVVNL